MTGTSSKVNRTFNQRVSVKENIDTQGVIESMRKWLAAMNGIPGFEVPPANEQAKLLGQARLVMIKAVTRGFIA